MWEIKDNSTIDCMIAANVLLKKEKHLLWFANEVFSGQHFFFTNTKYR